MLWRVTREGWAFSFSSASSFIRASLALADVPKIEKSSHICNDASEILERGMLKEVCK